MAGTVGQHCCGVKVNVQTGSRARLRQVTEQSGQGVDPALRVQLIGFLAVVTGTSAPVSFYVGVFVHLKYPVPPPSVAVPLQQHNCVSLQFYLCLEFEVIM